MARTYYTLVVRQEDGKWYPQFGDYDRSTVADEADNTYWNRNGGSYRRQDMKIVSSGARQQDITAAIAKLNDSSK